MKTVLYFLNSALRHVFSFTNFCLKDCSSYVIGLNYNQTCVKGSSIQVKWKSL